MDKILVTGADGFIGSHLTEALLARGYRVKALTLYNSFNYWGWLEDIPRQDNLEVVQGDVRDPDFCRQLTKNMDVVFHLAALIAIPFSYKAPDSYIDTNVKGTLNICQAARHNGVRKLVHTSTSEVYGTAQYVPIDEYHPKQPQSPYSASKIAADMIALSFYHAYGLPVTIARPFNTYGPRQSARAVIPSIIIQIAAGAKKIRLGDLSPTRDFNYVSDVCNGFLALAGTETGLGSEVNIASGTEISIADVVQKIKGLMHSDIEVISEKARLRPEKSEVFRLLGDNRRIRSKTEWQPTIVLEEGLIRTIDWFTSDRNLSMYKSDVYNI